MLRSRRLVTLACALPFVITACGGGGEDSGDGGTDTASQGSNAEPVTLRFASQYAEDDYRGVLSQMFADEVDERTDGSVTFEIYPNGSLMKPTETYQAMRSGSLDAAVLPLDYASGQVPEFSMAIMPAVVQTYQQAENWQDAEIGQRMQEIAEENGLHITVWNWGAGAFGVKGGSPVVVPGDIPSGQTARGAGPYAEMLLEHAGYSITSMPSSDIYNGFQTGILDAVVTTPSSFCAFNLQEQIDSYTSPSEPGQSWWFTLHPIVVSTQALDKLSDDQREAIDAAAEAVQDFAYDTPIENDAACEQTMADAGVEVAHIEGDQYQEWVDLAQPVWEQFGKDVEGGQELIELAREVPTE